MLLPVDTSTHTKHQCTVRNHVCTIRVTTANKATRACSSPFTMQSGKTIDHLARRSLCCFRKCLETAGRSCTSSAMPACLHTQPARHSHDKQRAKAKLCPCAEPALTRCANTHTPHGTKHTPSPPLQLSHTAAEPLGSDRYGNTHRSSAIPSLVTLMVASAAVNAPLSDPSSENRLRE
jgi:hypothetical protein